MIPEFPLAPFVRSFFEDHLVCRRNASPHTIRSYRDALKLFLRFTATLLGKAATRLLVTDVSEGVVATFLADLERTRGNKRKAASILGVYRPTLYNKLKKYNLLETQERAPRAQPAQPAAPAPPAAAPAPPAFKPPVPEV